MSIDKEYDKCIEAIDKLIVDWDKMRSDEELVVLVLPKNDRTARKDRLQEICNMLLNEDWENPHVKGK